MVCPKCGSANVNVQAINQVQIKNKHHGILWWLFIGWWWVPIKWLFLTLPALIVKIFKPKSKKVINTTKSIAVCQNCGHQWEV